MLYRESELKSKALSREEVVTSGVEAAEELTALVGFVVVAAEAMVAGLVEAKRIPAPFRIKVFVFENWDLAFVRRIDARVLERSGLDLMGVFFTEEENCNCKQWLSS
jgi:hypothetical protein